MSTTADEEFLFSTATNQTQQVFTALGVAELQRNLMMRVIRFIRS
jgi:hypothetical protein